MRSLIRRPRLKVFLPIGLLIALFLAGFLSYYASGSPDGLEKVAGDVLPGIASHTQEHAQADTVFAGYSTDGVGNDRLSGAIAGIVGVAITLAVASLLFLVVRRRRGRPTAEGTERQAVGPAE